MGTTLLVMYLKLNVLLLAAWVLWWGIKRSATWLGFEIGQVLQLRMARLSLMGSLLLVPLTALLDAIIPWWTIGVAGILAGREIIVTAALEQTLEQQSLLSAFGFDLLMVASVLFAVCFLIQGSKVIRQLQHLNEIVSNATSWKKIHGIELRVSTTVTTPFSTRALGGRHIVLPADLLVSPRNFKLAIKHELQHVRNCDLEWVILLEAMKTLCSWNPAVWLWHNEFDCLQEFACDEVLVNDRQVSRTVYGNCLLEVASAAKGSVLLASSNMVPRFSFWQDNQQQLRRRILMLMKPGRKSSTMKSVCCFVVMGAALLLEAGCVASSNQSPETQPDLIPVSRVPPNYPPQALAEKKEAWVQLEFSTDASGAVYEPNVVDHCVYSQGTSGKDCDAKSDLFDEAALTAISKWTYESEARKGVQTVLRFQLTK